MPSLSGMLDVGGRSLPSLPLRLNALRRCLSVLATCTGEAFIWLLICEARMRARAAHAVIFLLMLNFTMLGVEARLIDTCIMLDATLGAKR